MQSTLRVCAALTGLSFASLALATPIYFQESIGGDLPAGGPLPNFVFGTGQNVIAGNNTLSDYDAFAFTIPSGYQMLGGGLVLTDHDGNISEEEWYIGTGASADLANDVADLDVGSPSASVLPALGPGVYHARQVFMSQTANDSSADYVFTFDVVPEPASLALIGFGPLALLRARKRQPSA